MWAQVLAAMAARMTAADPQLDVRVGASAEVPLQRRVLLIRGPGTPQREFAETGSADQTVYIECWEHNDNPAAANTALAALEDWVAEQLVRRLDRLLANTDAIVTLQDIAPDNDAFRPSVGSRMTLRLRLRRATPQA